MIEGICVYTPGRVPSVALCAPLSRYMNLEAQETHFLKDDGSDERAVRLIGLQLRLAKAFSGVAQPQDTDQHTFSVCSCITNLANRLSHCIKMQITAA